MVVLQDPHDGTALANNPDALVLVVDEFGITLQDVEQV
jgi:hypothetical protein